jgi:hypothetical protein
MASGASPDAAAAWTCDSALVETATILVDDDEGSCGRAGRRLELVGGQVGQVVESAHEPGGSVLAVGPTATGVGRLLDGKRRR